MLDLSARRQRGPMHGVGLGFLAKMLQALLVVPAFGLTYLVAAPVDLATRIRRLLLSAVAMVAAAPTAP